MRFHPSLVLDLSRYLLACKIAGRERFPLVLMLEPCHRCNLACGGCGRRVEFRESGAFDMPLESCLEAVEETGAPVVTVTGGEPLLYPDVFPLIESILQRGRHIYFCTNGTLLEEALGRMKPSPRFNINVSLDGLEPTHDGLRNAPGVFRKALSAMRKAKEAGFRVVSNTTVYRRSDPEEIASLFDILREIGVDGILLSPAFPYGALDPSLFLAPEQAYEKFSRMADFAKRYPLISSPLYMKFLRGETTLPCTPWANPTRNIHGWKSPCYLITDRYFPSFRALMEQTDWSRYERGEDPRCRGCMVHCGFEPSVTLGRRKALPSLMATVRSNHF